jgi:hypothetical protein
MWRWEPWPLDDDSFVEATIVFVDGGRIQPGEVGLVEIEPLSPTLWADVKPGQSIGAYEGRRRVATGVVARALGQST